LRYINKIEFPAPDTPVDIGDYIQAVPGIPASLLRESLSQFIQRVEMPVREAEGVLILQSGSVDTQRAIA